eukprot:gnl/TRDRNA2_/TRDRNA2_160949_c0_seq1.p1 gnl/TRDRNA2_/TRDRNA2_160949_c0~~gnl/TRDRNA2_/TRDRNA2_160949_c0_seq1.p1  ORF type:complete len:101 (-),score=5.73 gnl/TRDRNA2_/TRDRNA2_160949_c0_seq1:324-626(-)
MRSAHMSRFVLREWLHLISAKISSKISATWTRSHTSSLLAAWLQQTTHSSSEICCAANTSDQEENRFVDTCGCILSVLVQRRIHSVKLIEQCTEDAHDKE